jgi:hypothetical protein
VLARQRWIHSGGQEETTEHAARVDEFNMANRRLFEVHAELRLLATGPVAHRAKSVIDGVMERHAAVHQALQDASTEQFSALRHANRAQEERIQHFIDVASAELGVRKG